MTSALPRYLLAIRGTLAPKTLEAARAVHNRTAGAPANVAAAQGLGDLSHMVYVPTAPSTNRAGELLILDVWRDMEGLGTFFANKQVQEQAAEIFTSRDPVVFAPADGLLGYQLPVPHGRNDRIVAVVRGPVRSRAEAEKIHNDLVGSQVADARRAGHVSHEPYFRAAAPDSAEALEFFAVDVWTAAEPMMSYYNAPAFRDGLQKLFASAPVTSTWMHPPGDWVEW